MSLSIKRLKRCFIDRLRPGFAVSLYSLTTLIVYTMALTGCRGYRETQVTPEVIAGDLSVPDLSRGAGEEREEESGGRMNYQLDDTLRVNHLQALGTHNSYHLASEIDILPWRYSHLPLDEQLEEQGVRQFELDIYEVGGEFKVYHIERLDPNTTCETLRDCLEVMSVWSARRSTHHPLLVLLEVKSIERSAGEAVRVIEMMIEETWGRSRVLTPNLVQRGYSTLREGLEAEGWPHLGEVRGRLLAVLHSGGALREALLTADGGLEDRLLFPDAYGDLSAPFAAYHSMNDPISGFERIQDVVRAGHLVRTRSDVDGEAYRDLDYTRADLALMSGAHWISTDYPRAPQEGEYGFVIPEGTPSRCNPLTAPPACSPDQIE